MKRVLSAVFVIMAICLALPLRVSALQTNIFDEDIRQIEGSLSDDVREDMRELGAGGIEEIIGSGIDSSSVLSYIGSLIIEGMRGPFAALTVILAVIIMASLAESYTYSLRYTETKDIMGTVVSLFVASAAVLPVSELTDSSMTVIKGAASVMLVYLPVMAGIIAFSGHAISSAGYYAAVVSASQAVSWLCSAVLAPLMNILLSLAVSSGICSRLRLNGIIETISKGFKYILTFAACVFTAVLGLNAALSGTGDSVAGRAARFTLSSFIPLIGSSIAEAYSALSGSVNILRSGMGVFVILSVFVSFAPVLVRAVMWSVSVSAAKLAAETFSVASAGGVLNALSSFLSSLRATLICVMTAFIIASAVMIHIGGAS